MAQTTFRKGSGPKTRTVSSNEAKQHWGSMMTAASNGEAIIVESHGKPKAVVISPEAFEAFRDASEKQRRAEALRRFDELQHRLDSKNQDLTDEQVDELANRFSHEFIDDLAEEGKISFARDQK